MTKINRVTIHGFKSFAHKTDIPFENEFNCILGPNGSGKSNIGDALCFVLGRLSAKSMRAEKAANLIFNGGKSKKPASSGSVEIAFCNKNKVFPIDDKEIVINRQISKKGNSTYRINGNKKTRGEVLDFLGLAKINPDGYNIILQGDITRFVTMSPTERRRIIEEISDVAIYEDKKHKAMLELNKVEEKMNSAEIILKERKTYLKELKKDRDQALKFKSFKDKIDSNKATYLHMQIKDNQEKHQKIEKQIKDHQVKINNFEKKIEQIKVKVNEDKEKISTINKEIEQKGEKGQLEVHREIENLKVTNAQDKTRISTLKDEINKIKQRKDQFQQEIKELENKSSSSLKNQKGLQKEIDRKEKDLIEIKQKIEQFKKKHKIESSQELDKEIEDKDKLIDQKQEEIQKVRQQQQELLREKDRIEYQFETIDEKIKKVKEIKQENKDQIKTLQKHKINFKHSTLRLNKCLENDSSFASQLANARRSLSELHEKQAKLNAKTLTAQASLSANQALQAILNNKNNFSGVHGTVADLGQVKKKYSLALEMTAGGKMQNLVVDNDKTAAECIRHLKVNKLGSASFIPLNKIKYQEINFEQQKLTKIDGVHDFAINLISFKPQYKKAFKNVFGSTLIVENIDIARKVGIGTIKMATLEGNIVEASGVMRGGFIKRRSGIAFKEKDSLEALNKIDNETAEIEGVIHNITNKREANEKEISSLRNLRAELEAEIIKLEKTLHLDTDDLDATSEIKKELSNKLKEVDQELEKIQKQVSLINKELAGLKSKKHMLRSQVNELRNPRLLAQLSAFEESKQQTREAVLKLESDLRNSSTSLEQLYSPELNKIKEIMQQHDKEEIKFKEEIKTLSSKISGNEKELTEKEKESKVFYSKYKQLFNQREKIK